MKNNDLSIDQMNARMNDMQVLIGQLQQRTSSLEEKLIQMTEQNQEQKKEEDDFFDSVTEGGTE